jgi:hypothetical protein
LSFAFLFCARGRGLTYLRLLLKEVLEALLEQLPRILRLPAVVTREGVEVEGGGKEVVQLPIVGVR